MSNNQLIRIPLFIVLFSIGASALAAAVLCNDLLDYYQIQHQIDLAQRQIIDLQNLNEDYRILAQRLTDNPRLVRRLAPVTPHTQEPDPNRIDPAARAEQLLAAQEALSRSQPAQQATLTPAWLERCKEPRRRMSLFLAGGALVLISFIFFGMTKPVLEEEVEDEE